MVNPTPPPAAVNPSMTSHQEIKTRVPVVKPDTAHPVGAPQESNRSKKSKDQKGKNKDREPQQNHPESDEHILDISI